MADHSTRHPQYVFAHHTVPDDAVAGKSFPVRIVESDHQINVGKLR